jgi:deferrochelatase/peroxidase EfeB
MTGISRRQVLAGGAGLVGVGVAGAVTWGGLTKFLPDSDVADIDATDIVPFTGAHQAGIITPAQDRLYFAAFDVVTSDRSELRRMLDAWTVASERMTAGLESGENGALGGRYLAPPDDTGEALGLSAAHLTITVGVGRSLFVGEGGVDRGFGLANKLPAALVDLPRFSGDALDPTRVGGDLCVQACSDDPQVAFHAVRNLARIGFGVISLRWSQLGFGRTSSTTTDQATPRNLFGFKDGTANVMADDQEGLDTHVWVQPGDDPNADWLVGGTYLVARRINMHIETWDRSSLAEQEAVVGRTKGTGAPLSGGEEFTEVDFEISGNDGQPLVAIGSHVRLAHPTQNGGVRMLRRGYNFTEGSNGLGRLDAGLFFIAYVRDPRTQFIPMQTNMARNDLLAEYLLHTGSGLFAVLPGVPSGGSYADRLLN